MTSGNSTPGLRRYVPYVAIVAVLVIAGIVFAVTRSDDGDGEDVATSYQDVQTALTFDEATDQGIDTSDWKHCDQTTGRVAIPNAYTPACVQPRQDDDDISENVQGVTEDSITIVVYVTDPENDPLNSAAFAGLSIDTDPGLAEQNVQDYIDLFAEYYETYGRDIDLKFYRATGAGSDQETARADAIAIAEQYKPFAVTGGPAQSPIFAQEMAARGIVCVATCTLAPQHEVALDSQPYLFPSGPTPEQVQFHASEFIGKQLVGRNAVYAGDEALHDTERVFGYSAYNTPDAYYTPMIEMLQSRLRDEYDTEIAVLREHELNLEVAAERSEATIAAMKEAGVTTVIISGDPLTPGYLTRAATTQNYYPEWVITGNVYVDSTSLARTTGLGGYDADQWRNAFGISVQPARGELAVQGPYMLYQWQYCHEPPSNVFNVHVLGAQALLTGIHLAGPDLTPETFHAATYKAPPRGGVPTVTMTSRGEHGVWPDFDPGGGDDAMLIYWDADEFGTSEVGIEGQGMYRFVDFGQRYLPLEWPTEEIVLFDPETSPTAITDFAGVEMLPPYDSPCGGPPAQAPSGATTDE